MANYLDETGLLKLWSKIKSYAAKQIDMNKAIVNISASGTTLTVTKADGTKVTLDPVFNARKKEYTIVVPKTLESVVFKATARTAANSEIKVNGKIAENGEYTLALTGDDAKVVTEIEVGNENTVAGKYLSLIHI